LAEVAYFYLGYYDGSTTENKYHKDRGAPQTYYDVPGFDKLPVKSNPVVPMVI
jgi:hypothetical protein